MYKAKWKFYSGWEKDFESDCAFQCGETHRGLVTANLNDFGNSGYDGMSWLCDNDHELIYFITPEVILRSEVNCGWPCLSDYTIAPLAIVA